MCLKCFNLLTLCNTLLQNIFLSEIHRHDNLKLIFATVVTEKYKKNIHMKNLEYAFLLKLKSFSNHFNLEE